jgi:putative CocE/NonD family hydrolase
VPWSSSARPLQWPRREPASCGNAEPTRFMLRSLSVVTVLASWCVGLVKSRLPSRLALAVTVLCAAGNVQGAQPTPGAFERPSARYELTVKKDVMIPMRDGVRLATDVYLPLGAGAKVPVILIRTPYGKNKSPVADASFFAGQGFAVVVQDFRGKFRSEGLYRFNRGHREDGYDTFAWIMRQSWSSGKIGTYGCSYLGEVQLYQAQSQPPGLVAMIPQASGGAIGSAGGYYMNGNDLGSGNWGIGVRFDWWYWNGTQVYYGPRQAAYFTEDQLAPTEKSYRAEPDLPVPDYKAVLESLPVIDMMKRAGAPPNEWRERVVKQTDLTDPYWRSFDYVTDDSVIDAPTLFIESWNDWGTPGTLYARNLFEKKAPSKIARDNQYIIVSPSPHCRSEAMTQDQMIGDLPAGDPRFGHWDIYLRWFNHWLKGDENHVTDMPKVQYYVLGENKWKAANEWPVAGTQLVKFFLHSLGSANTHFGNGTLSRSAPSKTEPADRWTYDPGSPTPSLGTNDYQGSKPVVDQRALSARGDILVYTSDPLRHGMEITGEIELHIFVSSSARDTDFVGKLVDVYPDGRALNVREGILRARYRHGRDKPPELMKPGQIYELTFRLGSYSQYFDAAHRVRLQIASAAFPRYERNLNTGGGNYDETEWVVAHNTLFHDTQHESYVTLPIVPK